MTEVWNENERLLSHAGRGVVLDTMREYFGVWLAMALRREIDGGSDSVSLRRLLEEMERHAPSLTEAQLRRLWDDPSGRFTSRTFPNYADPSGTHLDPAVPRAHVEQLVATSDALRLFVNRNLAHRSRRENVPPPTFDELHVLADTCETIAKPYVMLLTGAAYSFSPVEQFEWIDIFDFPWRV